ncbi:Mre11 DNA-binding presumed domain-containing protein [Gymnopilus junonius]|uniref:Mre11 DNA-binding presumed domain-containing protein n=1 Tax=Gymnopilus junonius TaxID=109634 RepID=A0A9P5TL53_GYMJU|nr:Mre11 DNA-binding presumed domain-containing protein [Gymnopilus junonius]
MGKIDLPLNEGEASSSSGIMVRPVLLRKGTTRLGLYGIGNVKDQRMHFELRSNRVKMFMPRDKDKWFNMLLLHQNRVKHGPQEFVPEGMFDDSVDLVVWGHEHDCRIVPEPVAGKNYYITQPGSSVATSLADGEAIEKHVALLQIQGKEFKLTPIPLRTVRPFVIEQVVLNEVAEEEGVDLNDQMSITKYLKAKVNALIDQANQLWDERNAKAVEEGEPELPRMLPLVRLKVDTTGVTETSNPIRFGQEFQGRIANPRDLLTFHRSKRSAAASSNSKSGLDVDQPELSIDDPTLSVSEKLARVRVGTLVREYLAAQELQLLGEGGMSDAIQMFVEKDDTHAIQAHVTKALKVLMKNVQPTEDIEVDEGDLDDMVPKAKAKSKSKESDNESVDSIMMDVDMDVDEDEEALPPPPKRRAAAAAKAKPAAAKAPAKKTTAAKKAPAKTAAKKSAAKGKGKKVESDSDEVIELDDDDDDNNNNEEDDDEDEEPEPEPAPKPTKRTNRAAVLSQPATTTTKKAPAKRAAAHHRAGAHRRRSEGRMIVDDDDDDDD